MFRFFFQAEDGIRDADVTGVQTCALPILPMGKGVIRRQGQKVAFLAFGAPVAQALEVADILDATVADMRFVKPMDAELVVELASTHNLLVTRSEERRVGKECRSRWARYH